MRDKDHKFDCFIAGIDQSTYQLETWGYYIHENPESKTEIRERKYWPADARQRVHRWDVQK